MPFGKRLLTSAVEGESKQSCVIFSFYFMPLAATKHDGCGSLVFFRIVHHLNHIYKYWHTASAHVSLFYIHRPFFLGKGELIAKIQIFFGIRVSFYHFLHLIHVLHSYSVYFCKNIKKYEENKSNY